RERVNQQPRDVAPDDQIGADAQRQRLGHRLRWHERADLGRAVPDPAVVHVHPRQSTTPDACARHIGQTRGVERVTGIGGFFFKADDPDALSRWYAEHLGVGLPPSSLEDDVAADEEWYQEAGPTVFAPFGPQHWESPHLGKHQWGVNFRVHDLDALVAQL